MPNLKINEPAQAQTNPSDPKNLGLISYGPQGGLWLCILMKQILFRRTNIMGDQ